MGPFYFWGKHVRKGKNLKEQGGSLEIPRHIAIIMDGNGRWAAERGLTRTQGHRRGIERVQELITSAQELKIPMITLFAFSTENWKRPRTEILKLFSYMTYFLMKSKKKLIEDNVRLTFIGRRDRIDRIRLRQMEDIESRTKDNDSLIVNIALDYGGRWDIVSAVNRILADCAGEKKKFESLDEETFAGYLSLAEFSEPELLIRTSGELRLSNFLLWQAAYSELYFTDCYWPDFDRGELLQAIRVYTQRERRFGKIAAGKKKK